MRAPWAPWAPQSSTLFRTRTPPRNTRITPRTTRTTPRGTTGGPPVVILVVLVVLEVLLELLETQNPFSKTFFKTLNKVLHLQTLVNRA